MHVHVANTLYSERLLGILAIENLNSENWVLNCKTPNHGSE